MKLYFILFCSLFLTALHAQETKKYTYYLYLSDYQNAPQFERGDDYAVYVGNDAKLKAFFSQFSILSFHQAFPEYVKSNDLLSVFYVKTLNSDFLQKLRSQFPSMVRKVDDLTNEKIELMYYPNDYGTTSPVPNLGANVQRKELDYLHAPEAWDITKGRSDILLGISDTAIDTTAADLNNGKVYIVPGYGGFTTSSSHGTGVAEIAAGRGNNAHGSVGVCMDCNMVAAHIDYGGINGNGDPYGGLYQLANAGARVINMSWGSYTNDLAASYSQARQDVFNYLVDEFGVIFVGAAGNMPSFSTPQSFHSYEPGGVANGVPQSQFGKLYIYPASYGNVISVSSVNHKNPRNNMPAAYCCTSPWFPIYIDLEDSAFHSADGTDVNNPIGIIRNGYYINQYNPDGFQWGHTVNEEVDILATGYNIFWYANYLTGQGNYASGTSASAPHVTGTIGLMLSVDDCLNSTEVESILKLSTKDVEHMALNQAYFGYLGAGKLEIYDSVKFVDEMNKPNGNAVINDHIFYRFNFLLERINNKLSIENITFKDACTADFTARNVIEVLPGSDFAPATGFVDLKIDQQLDMDCSNTNRPAPQAGNKAKAVKTELAETPTRLYPNPNNGIFAITFGKQHKNVTIEVFDIYGKSIYMGTTTESTVNLNIQGISAGMYIVKLSSDNYCETLKFVKK